MAAVSAAEGDVGLFELCNPHLLATDLLQRLLLPLHLRPSEREEAVYLARSHLSPRPQRRKRRRGEGSEKRGDGEAAVEILIDGNSEQQKSAEEKLKERLKAKFGDTHAREEGESSSKRPKITWP